MTIYLDTEEEKLGGVERGLIEQAIRAAAPTVKCEDLSAEESSRIKRVESAGAAIQGLPHPKLNDYLSPSKISEAPSVVLERVAAVARDLGLTPPTTNTIFDVEARRAELMNQSDEKNDEIGDLINGVARLEMDKALLGHELAAPQTDASMVDYLARSDEQLTKSYGTAVKAAAPFPHLAREIMKLGLAMEKHHTENKLGVYKKQGDDCKAKIDMLLKLSAQLPRVNSEDSSYEVKEETKAEISKIAEELKANGIDIFPGSEVGKEISKDQLAAANSLINHHIDAHRTNLQELFTTKISVSIQFLQMMTEVMKKVSELHDRGVRKAQELR